MNKDFIKYFLEGFFSIFKIIPVKTKQVPRADISEYFRTIEKDIALVYTRYRNK